LADLGNHRKRGVAKRRIQKEGGKLRAEKKRDVEIRLLMGGPEVGDSDELRRNLG